MKKLPHIMSDEELDSIDRTDQVYCEAAVRIARRHDLPDDSIELFPAGSVFVFRCGNQYVIKLFPPYCQHHCQTERTALEELCSHLPGIVPRPYHSGELDGWFYLVMDRQAGVPLDECWSEIDPDERKILIGQAADLVRSLHMIAHQKSKLPRPDWQHFIETQRKNCMTRHKQYNLNTRWLDQIPDFLDSVEFQKYDEKRVVILHTEVMRQHLLVKQENNRHVITGLIDFEPAMIGDFEYELASVCLFVTGTDTHLFPVFLEHVNPELLQDPGLTRRVLAYILLHRYSYMAWFLEIMPPVNSFDDCLNRWFQ